MDTDTILDRLRAATGFPWAAHLWEVPPSLPYGVLSFDTISALFADNTRYLSHVAVRLDLYDANHNPDAEQLVESFLDAQFPAYTKDPAQPVQTDDAQTLFQTSYQFEVIQNNEQTE